MIKNTSTFQLALTGIFVFFIIAGLVSFSLYKGGGSGKQEYTVTMWGTVDQRLMSSYLQSVTQASNPKVTVVYQQRSIDTIDQELLEALALGQGPDLLVMPQDRMWKHENKIIRIPYDVIPERDFKTNYVQGSEVYLTQQGIVAVPFYIDPLVMYWNRDIFTNAGLALPPATWEELQPLVSTSKLTKLDPARNIVQSAIGIGEFRNVKNAKEIVSLLMMQAGNSVTARGIGVESRLRDVGAPEALTFYTQFADPIKEVYSWNRAMPNSQTAFLSNSLGLYLGYASEYNEIRSKNPNLNFDVALVPQAKEELGVQSVKMTYGRVYGFSILRTAPSGTSAALLALNALVDRNALLRWSQASGLPVARRDALTYDTANAASSVFATSALISRAWLDPDGVGTTAIFGRMIESVTSGRLSARDAAYQAHNELSGLTRLIP